MRRPAAAALVAALAAAVLGAARANADSATDQSWGGGITACHTTVTTPFKFAGYARAPATTSCTGDVIQIYDTMGLYRNGNLVAQVSSSSEFFPLTNHLQEEADKECGGGGHTWRAEISVCAYSVYNGGRCWALSSVPVWLNTC